MSGLAEFTDKTLRALETAQIRVGAIMEPNVRLGVTGLSRAGKTVFVTALAASLLRRGRMDGLMAQAEGRIDAAMLRPHPDAAVPRFDYEDHLAALSAPEPQWPESTRWISQLRLSLRYRSRAFSKSAAEVFAGPSTLNVDIIDYPGEWLLDLPLMSLSYAQWRAQALTALIHPARAPHSAAFRAWLERVPQNGPEDETLAREGAALYTAYLGDCRKAGLSAAAPGRFLMPGDLDGSPALTFAPLTSSHTGAFERLMSTRFEAYKRVVIKPFFRDHFSRLDRQIVLVDALTPLNAGPAAVADMRQAMDDILTCFRPGANSWLAPLLGKRVDRILFAATKADHIHHTQHDPLIAVLRALMDPSARRAEYAGAKVETTALAAVRATAEQTVRRDGQKLDCVRGRLLDTGQEGALYPGALPETPAEIVAAADEAARAPADAANLPGWMSGEYQFMRFAPPRLALSGDVGPRIFDLIAPLNFCLAINCDDRLMRLKALSDLHLGNTVNRDALRALPAFPDDWLIVAGDVAERFEHIRFGFDQLTRKFAQVFWTPGNHELWAAPEQPGGAALAGQERYDALIQCARDYGVITPEDPFKLWEGAGGPHVIAPLFVLYDYSFRPDDVPRADVVAWARARRSVCADERFLRPDPWPSRDAWCDHRCAVSEARLRAISPDTPTILINHFPLRRDLIHIPRAPRFTPWCGTRRTEDWHTRFNAKVAVSGHLHTRRADWRGATRFEEVSLGYPRQWDQSLGVAFYLRDVTPD